jgi:hypothetical protein
LQYENCSEKFHNGEDPDVLTFIARAYFLENDVDLAKKALSKVFFG